MLHGMPACWCPVRTSLLAILAVRHVLDAVLVCSGCQATPALDGPQNVLPLRDASLSMEAKRSSSGCLWACLSVW